jgi:hypothetical protein
MVEVRIVSPDQKMNSSKDAGVSYKLMHNSNLIKYDTMHQGEYSIVINNLSP